MKKMLIEISEKQYNVLLEALDFYTKMGTGQWGKLESIMNLLNQGHNEIGFMADIIQLRNKYIPDLKEYVSYGISSAKVPQEVKIGYDLYKILNYKAKFLNDNENALVSNLPPHISNLDYPKITLEELVLDNKSNDLPENKNVSQPIMQSANVIENTNPYPYETKPLFIQREIKSKQSLTNITEMIKVALTKRTKNVYKRSDYTFKIVDSTTGDGYTAQLTRNNVLLATVTNNKSRKVFKITESATEKEHEYVKEVLVKLGYKFLGCYLGV